MRCLRQIGDIQYTGQVYLSAQNKEILNRELEDNFRLSVDELQGAGTKKIRVETRPLPPPRKIKLKRVRRQYEIEEKDIEPGLSLDLADIDKDKYRLIHTTQQGMAAQEAAAKYAVSSDDISDQLEQRIFGEITLVAEIARYLNKPCLFIREILASTVEGTPVILESVNEFNEILYDWIIPKLFQALYDITPDETTEEYEVS